MKQVDIFETSNVDLSAYLMFSGIKFLECRKDLIASQNKEIVVMRFLDEKQNCRDLERVFMSSDFKKYRDLVKYLLKEVHSKLRETA
jgi:hypothetical protein